MTARIAVVAAVNRPDVLAANLARSPMIASGAAALHVERDPPSISIAYNRGLDAVGDAADLVVFAHQDVYLPAGWDDRLRAAAAAANPDWALLGVIGVARADGAIAGQVWCAANGGVIGEPLGAPTPAQSFDELVIVLRRDSGLRFDDALPDYHLYGADIVQTAWAAGRGAYVAQLPVVHNSRPVRGLAGGFMKAAAHMRRKWRDSLPIRTPVVWLERNALNPWRKHFWLWRTRAERARAALDPGGDPAAVATQLGWERCDATPV